MFRGLNNIGAGVSNMDASIKWYAEELDFTDVLFDYTGELPGMEKLTGSPVTKARVVMLANPRQGHYGIGLIRLVQILEPYSPPPIPEGFAWGELGIAEICVECLDAAGLEQKYKDKGYEIIMPLRDDLWMDEEDHSKGRMLLFYISDPDGCKIEFIENPFTGPGCRCLGVYHTAPGVSDMDKSLKFYERLGFTEPMWPFDGYEPAMYHWHGGPQWMHMELVGNFRGGAIELVQQKPDIKDCRGQWGHLGAMDFQIETTNIEVAYEELKAEGVEFLSEPVTIDLGGGKQWKYAYFWDPDKNYVALTEQRF